MENNNSILLSATFNPIVKVYIWCYVAFILLVSVIGIPFFILWIFGLGVWWTKHYFDKLLCELSERNLRFRQGILFQVDKTIPLENIQDLTFYEGPLLRMFNLTMLRVETAGMSHYGGNSMTLVGINDAHVFREMVLKQRQKIKDSVDKSIDEKILSTLQSIETILKQNNKND